LRKPCLPDAATAATKGTLREGGSSIVLTLDDASCGTSSRLLKNGHLR
jgi:hypothetical protein